MNMRYAKRSEDTEQINVVSWAGWNMSRYPELKWLFHVPNGGSRNKQEAVETSRRQSNSNRWVSKRVFLICASHIRKAHTAGYSLK